VGPYGSGCIYKDYRLKEWWYSNDGHCSENEVVKIHSKIYGWIINYGYLTDPDIGDSVTNVRMTEAACWKAQVKFNPGLSWVWVECPGNTVCCQKVWKVKNYGPPIGVLSTLVDIIPFGQQNCYLEIGQMYQVCQSFCSPDPRIFWRSNPNIEDFKNGENSKNEQIIFDSKISPNPSEGKCEIRIESRFTGMLQVEIRNILGELVSQHNVMKGTNDAVLQINMKNMSKGIYLYQINVNGNPVTKSQEFIIE